MSPIAINATPSYRIACVPGDGIGPEVVSAGVQVLKTVSEASDFDVEFETYDWSSETFKKTGQYIPDGGLDRLRKHDAILFGAVGAPDVPDHISLWGLRLAICQPLQQYANVRPTRIFPGTESPLRKASTKDLDWVIIRENSEGEYAGQGQCLLVSLCSRHLAHGSFLFRRSNTSRLPMGDIDGGRDLHKAQCRAVDAICL